EVYRPAVRLKADPTPMWGPASAGPSHARHLELRHRRPGKQPLARTSHPTRDANRSRVSRRIGRNSRVGVHLSIELRDEHEGDPTLQGTNNARSAPDPGERIEGVAQGLSPAAGWVGGR